MTLDFSKENQSSLETAYRFGNFELYPSERLLKRDGTPVSVQPKVFDALLLLVSRAQHLVSKQELKNQLWPDVHVSETNLTNTIVSVRKLLGRNSIRTVSKHGYRFELAMVSEPGLQRTVYERFAHARQLIEHRSMADMQGARDLLTICLAEDPSFAQGWAWLGRCCWFLDKFGQDPSLNSEVASAALQRALVLAPDLTDAHQFLTFLQVDTGQAADAVTRLSQRRLHHPFEPETYAGLVQALRFQGLLTESVEAHHCAIELDRHAATSIAHTLFLAGDFASAVEAYTGRAAYYLDAAAWAALGLSARAAELLRQRLKTMLLSPIMTALMHSLLAALEGDTQEAVRRMEAAQVQREPEILVYFARHYSYLDLAEKATATLKTAADAGFLCAPETLRLDPWFAALRQSSGFERTLSDSEAEVARGRTQLRAELGGDRTLSIASRDSDAATRSNRPR